MSEEVIDTTYRQVTAWINWANRYVLPIIGTRVPLGRVTLLMHTDERKKARLPALRHGFLWWELGCSV